MAMQLNPTELCYAPLLVYVPIGNHPKDPPGDTEWILCTSPFVQYPLLILTNTLSLQWKFASMLISTTMLYVRSGNH